MREAAAFLLTRSVINRARQFRRRLKSPRYAIALLLGAGYLVLIFFGQPRADSALLPSGTIVSIGTLLLALFTLKWWLFGADRTALAFTPAEIQFLFPAPVSRAALLSYKLLRAQLPILLSVLIWTVLLHRHGAASLATPLYALGLWGFFATVFFHRLGVALQRDAVAEGGWRASWRALPVVLAIVLCIVITAFRVAPPAGGDRLAHARQIMETVPLSWLLWPFRLPLLPLAAESVAEWTLRFLGVLGLLLLHVIWIVRADVAFEDAALEATTRRTALLDRWRRQGGMASLTAVKARQWLPLGADGHPGLAILWKNVTRLIRTVRPVFPLLMIAVMVIGLTVGVVSKAAGGTALDLVAGLSLSWAALFSILGPQWIRIDLRGELEHLPLLRTWPVSGLVVMTSEVASSALVLTALQAVLAIGGTTALLLRGDLPIGWTQAVVLAVPMGLLLLAVNVISLSIQNGGALLYPSWVRTELRPGGIEMVGQQFLTAGASLLLLALAVLGPGLLGSGAGYLLWPHLALWSLGPATLLAAAGLGLEAFLILDWLGTRFEQFDPTAVN
ncbi:MAG: putative ABC exporter domain-containing protein [Gemmatimonadales bacterium]